MQHALTRMLSGRIISIVLCCYCCTVTEKNHTRLFQPVICAEDDIIRALCNNLQNERFIAVTKPRDVISVVDFIKKTLCRVYRLDWPVENFRSVSNCIIAWCLCIFVKRKWLILIALWIIRRRKFDLSVFEFAAFSFRVSKFDNAKRAQSFRLKIEAFIWY